MALSACPSMLTMYETASLFREPGRLCIAKRDPRLLSMGDGILVRSVDSAESNTRLRRRTCKVSQWLSYGGRTMREDWERIRRRPPKRAFSRWAFAIRRSTVTSSYRGAAVKDAWQR